MCSRYFCRNERFYGKMWGKTVRERKGGVGGGVCEIPRRLPMNDDAMETVECI